MFNLKTKVMARIYAEYCRYLAVSYFQYILGTLLLIEIGLFVSLGDVVQNMPTDNLANTLNFFVIAVRDTELILQVSALAFAIWSGSYIAKISFSKLTSSSSLPMRAS